MSETVLIEIRPRRAADAMEVPHRFSFRARGSAIFDSQYWAPKIISLPSWQQDIGFTGDRFGQLALPQVGELRVAASHVDAALIWKGARVEIRRAPWTTNIFGAVELYRVQKLSIADGEASIHLMDIGADLAQPVAGRKFGSTGVAVLDDALNVDLIGKVVPTGWGRIYNAPGYLVDRAYNIWLVLGRASAVIHGIYDGGAAFTAGAARSDLAALRANAPATATADYCGDAGGLTLIRPWTTPAYPLTADLTAAGTGNTAAGIAAAIIGARSGLTMAAGTVAAFDALISATCGVYVDDEATIAATLDFLIPGLGGWWGLNPTGEVELGRIDWTAPAATFDAWQIESIKREEMIFPNWARGVGYARLAKTHNEGEIATALLAGDISGLGDLAMQDSVDWSLQVTGAGKPEDGATRNIWRGIHNSSLTYAQGDQVSNASNDRFYIAKSAVPSGVAVTNTAYWDLTLVSGGGAAGDNALSARLSNPAILVPTAADGSGGAYTGLTSQVEFYDGSERKDQLGLVTFSLVGAPTWASINSTGLVTVTDWGGARAELKVDCTYGALTLRVTLTLIRTLQGAQGPSISLTGGGAFEYVDGIATAGQTRTFVATLSGITGTIIWTTTPLGIPLSGAGSSRTLAAADMGGHRQVTVRATISGLYDEDTAIRVDRSTAEAGATVGAPAGTSVGGVPVEIGYVLTPTGLREDWDKHADIASVTRAWYLDGPGATTLSVDDSMSGGRALRVVGSVNLIGNHRLAWAGEDLYRVTARIYVVVAGAANVQYLGMAAWDTAGGNLTSDRGSFHYTGGIEVNLPTGWHNFEGYFRGRAAPGTGADTGGPAPDPSAPGPLNSAAVSISPVFLANYGGSGGDVLIDYIAIEKVEDLTPLPSRPWVSADYQQRGQVVTWQGRSWIARIDNRGVAPPATSVGTATWGLLADKGADGAAGITTSGGVSLTVACADNGTVKAGELPRDFTVKLLQAGVDITATATWSVVDAAYVTATVLAAGSFRFSAISNDSGHATLRGTISGVNYDIPFNAAKAFAGSPAAGTAAACTFPATGSYVVLGTTGEIAVPSGRSVSVNGGLDWTSTGSSTALCYVEISYNSGSSWSSLGSIASGSTFPGEPSGTAAINEVIAASGSPRFLMVRIWGRRTGGPFANTSAVLGVSLL